MGKYKRFWVFMYDSKYPSGGMNDFCGSFDTLHDAQKFVVIAIKSTHIAHIVDSETCERYYM